MRREVSGEASDELRSTRTHRSVAENIIGDQTSNDDHLVALQRALVACSTARLARKIIADVHPSPSIVLDIEYVHRRVAIGLVELLAAVDVDLWEREVGKSRLKGYSVETNLVGEDTVNLGTGSNGAVVDTSTYPEVYSQSSPSTL